MKVRDEQAERIKESLKALQDDAAETGVMYSLQEFEDVCEDRDPFEFI